MTINHPRFSALRMSVPKGERECRRCGASFQPVTRNQKYCTRECERLARNERNRDVGKSRKH